MMARRMRLVGVWMGMLAGGGCASSRPIDQISFPVEEYASVTSTRECRKADTGEVEFVCNPDEPICIDRFCKGEEIIKTTLWKKVEPGQRVQRMPFVINPPR